MPRFGRAFEGGGPHPILAMVISAAGTIIAIWASAPLQTSVAYPLSRARRAAAVFRASLIDSGLFLVAVGTTLLLVGLAASFLCGYPLRLDYVPYFLRALAATLILLPLAHWGRLHLEIAARRKQANTLVALVLSVLAMVIVVSVWSDWTTRLGVSPTLELGVLIALFGISQLLFRAGLRRFYATRDLV